MKIISAIGAVLVTLFALTGAPAQAAPLPDSTVKAMVEEMIDANPGARQINTNTVRLANGVEASAVPASICPYYRLCIYDGEYRSGQQWNFLKCGFVNIGASGWSDRIRSFSNNQTPGTVAIFMNWTGSQWQELHRSTAYERQDTVGSVHWTDGLWVC
ncbi:hypothetical protein FKR81_28245 [Lentzea tibetensis]|uniref:Peptidase inhibitor family I36 n=1 Tax=Lentzea tibetensis TaxID=2591470 RepID=A0A563EMV8_9PSEU|nr:hypothetical protein [Lentzea tibetensis]TWP48482.1 hypothetical protein FKR81_28245 [Lentzea tibetensis]